MSYSYSYSLNDKLDDICFSDGARASFKADELHLSKHLPFPIDQVKFLAGSPYHFRIKPDADGKGTLVDWNWDGLFDETDVSADIYYSHGADCGPRYEVGKSQTAPVLVAHGSGPKPGLLLFYGYGGKLVMRTWQGKDRDTEGDKWSAESSLAETGVTGDPTATYMDGGDLGVFSHLRWCCFAGGYVEG